MKKVVIVVEIIILMALIIYLSIFKDNRLQNENSISMREAYLIAYEAMLKVNPHVLLYSMGSSDSAQNPEDKSAGKTGLRKYWNLDFAVPNTTDHWIVFVRSKKIYDIIKVMGFSLDNSNNFARIFINAKTKEVIDAIHKVTYDGVTYQWEEYKKP